MYAWLTIVCMNLRFRYFYENFLVIICFAVAGCTSDNIQQSMDFTDDCWHMQDTLEYQFPSPSRLDQGNQYLYVDFLEQYAFRNLFLKLMMSHPSGWSKDTLIEAVMVDEVGFWMVKKNAGTYSYIFPYQLPSPPDSLDTYTLKVTQYMRDSSLCDIRSVGIIALQNSAP